MLEETVWTPGERQVSGRHLLATRTEVNGACGALSNGRGKDSHGNGGARSRRGHYSLIPITYMYIQYTYVLLEHLAYVQRMTLISKCKVVCEKQKMKIMSERGSESMWTLKDRTFRYSEHGTETDREYDN